MYELRRDFVFLSTPSARRATRCPAKTICSHAISIHALREEGDLAVIFLEQLSQISIHALREEGDPLDRGGKAVCKDIYIHALRE